MNSVEEAKAFIADYDTPVMAPTVRTACAIMRGLLIRIEAEEAIARTRAATLDALVDGAIPGRMSWLEEAVETAIAEAHTLDDNTACGRGICCMHGGHEGPCQQ
jgi:hypothetical protein